MSKMKYYQFDKITKFIDYRGKTPKKTEYGIPLITAKNIKFGYLSEQPKEFISEADYDGWMIRGIPNKSDILFTTEAPLGNVCLLNTNEKRAFAQRAIIFQPINNDVYISQYLFYYLMSPPFTDELNSKKTGTTVKGIKSSILKKFQIPLPPLLEQQRIVTKLDLLFEKIDKSIALHQKNMDEADVFMGSVLNDVFGEFEEKYEKELWNDVLTIKNGKHYKDVIDENGHYPIYGSGGIMNYANQYICNEDTVIIGAKTHLLQINMVVPPLVIQQKVVQYLDEISEKTEKVKSVQKEKMESLKALKASILDRAFRGAL